jgi:hypothetical protein
MTQHTVAEYMEMERELVRTGVTSIGTAMFCFRAAFFGRVGTIAFAIRDAFDRRGRFNIGHRFDRFGLKYHTRCARLGAAGAAETPHAGKA